MIMRWTLLAVVDTIAQQPINVGIVNLFMRMKMQQNSAAKNNGGRKNESNG